ncbi:MAG TPA: SCP2 sterol-binding domain-containing protein [Steroidobacteraceae bacterium]|jgi:ubiquinone biosynthesis protein UbiJ|nr:SCP2 sterol-binding domain-containing protein [Steroidobacteraceae bacterium]
MLSGTIANLLNRGLTRSVRARQLLAELAGRSLAIEVRGIVRLRVQSNGALLAVAPDAAPADATVSGGLLGLLTLGAETAPAALERRGVEISGDAEIAARFRELAQLLWPDIEEELALRVGDVPAHQLARLGRLGLRWTRRAADTAWRNLAEYLGHESADLVPRREGEQFLRGVDALREDVDRLAARLELIARRRAAP